MTVEQIQSLFALAIGFAVAGLLGSAYQLATRRPASFRLLLPLPTLPRKRGRVGRGLTTFAAVPLLVFAAPFIIMRNTIRGRRIEGRRFSMVMIATIIAGGWSLLSGTVLVMALTALGVPAG